MISEQIKQVMEAKGLRQADLAVIFGSSLSRIKAITSGRIKNLTRQESEALVDKLNVRAEWLITGEGEMFLSETQDEMASRMQRINRMVALVSDLSVNERTRQQLSVLMTGEAEKDILTLAEAIAEQSSSTNQNALHAEQEMPAYKVSKTNFHEVATPGVLDGLVMVPKYDIHASAGGGALIHSEQVVDHLAFRQEWIAQKGLSKKALALIEVHGDSMEPSLFNNDLILIDLREDRFSVNGVYAIQHRGLLLVKRIQAKLDGSVVIKSDNPAYEPEVLNPEEAAHVTVVGRVVWYGREM